jgi:hypothetical protein
MHQAGRNVQRIDDLLQHVSVPIGLLHDVRDSCFEDLDGHGTELTGFQAGDSFWYLCYRLLTR